MDSNPSSVTNYMTLRMTLTLRLSFLICKIVMIIILNS